MNRNLITESLKCEKTYILLARAHVCTRITGVFVFLLSQVSHKTLQCVVIQIVVVCIWAFLINKVF